MERYYLYEDMIEACIYFNKKSLMVINLDLVVGTIYQNSEYRKKINKLVKKICEILTQRFH
jgi:hypothetical protein